MNNYHQHGTIVKRAHFHTLFAFSAKQKVDEAIIKYRIPTAQHGGVECLDVKDCLQWFNKLMQNTRLNQDTKARIMDFCEANNLTLNENNAAPRGDNDNDNSNKEHLNVKFNVKPSGQNNATHNVKSNVQLNVGNALNDRVFNNTPPLPRTLIGKFMNAAIVGVAEFSTPFRHIFTVTIRFISSKEFILFSTLTAIFYQVVKTASLYGRFEKTLIENGGSGAGYWLGWLFSVSFELVALGQTLKEVRSAKREGRKPKKSVLRTFALIVFGFNMIYWNPLQYAPAEQMQHIMYWVGSIVLSGAFAYAHYTFADMATELEELTTEN